MQTIDLRSDTTTVPTPAMRAIMAEAPVGDDVFGEDPSINLLQDKAAELLGKEASLYLPSGTMANQVALLCHTRPGDAVILGESSHTFVFESGGGGLIAGVLFDVVPGSGLFNAAQMEAAIHPPDYHFAPSRLVCLENTHNRSGGRVFPLSDVQAIGSAARERGLGVHMDGARLFNAVVATGTAASTWAASVDSICFCLSKGLGAPVGSILAGDQELIGRARRYRKMLGGGMRQAGILAAAGLHALENHVSDLALDHEHAQRFHEGVGAMDGLTQKGSPETNIIMFDTPHYEASTLVSTLEEQGVRLYAVAPHTIRVVTHRDVSSAQITRALEALHQADRALRA